MARDYSNRRNNRGHTGTKAGSKRQPAPAKKRRSAPKKNRRKKNTGTPMWVWVGCVAFLAVAVAAVAWIMTRPTGHPGRDIARVEVPQPQTTATTTPKPIASTQPNAQQPQFSFYKMLPNYEVVIPGEMEDIQRRNTSGGDGASTTQTNPPAAATADKTEHYIIQVGAFTNSADANQLKARVTLLGLSANVVRSEGESGQAIYRVRSNVIDSGSRLSEMLKRLHDHDIETLVLRRKK